MADEEKPKHPNTGNQFWLRRATHGRDMLFGSPTLLDEAAGEYFEDIVKNPIYSVDFKGKDATRVMVPHIEPFTINGMCLFFKCSNSWWRNFKANQKKIKNNEEAKEESRELARDFLAVIHAIEQIITRQKFSGAVCGMYNANIIAREMGLIDKTDLTSKGGKIGEGKTLAIEVVYPKGMKPSDGN